MMKQFYLYRLEDESGVSGIGVVAEGVQFSDGKCALSWLTTKSSKGFYDCIEHIIDIHGHGGKTKVLWENEVPTVMENMLAKQFEQANVYGGCLKMHDKDPDVMCDKCSCWKMTRKNCS